MKSFHDQALGLSYSYPAAYHDASGMVRAAFEASLNSEVTKDGKGAAHCLTLPFSAVSGDKGQPALIALITDSETCQGRKFTEADLPSIAENEVNGLTASGARPQFHQPAKFVLANHPAEMVRGTVALPTGQNMQMMAVCVLLEKDVACWQFITGSEAALRSLGSLPLSFHGAEPAPLVPPAFFDQH